MSEIEQLRREIEELKAREKEKDLELRAALLSIVSYIERVHGIRIKAPKLRRPETVDLMAPWNREP